MMHKGDNIMLDRKELAETIFKEHPIRFCAKEKDDFIVFAQERLRGMGYSDDDIHIMQSRGMMASRNIVIGDIEKAQKFITAHYDTPGRNGIIVCTSPLVGQVWANILTCVLIVPLMAVLSGLGVRLEQLFESIPALNGTLLTTVFGAILLPLIFLAYFIAIIFIKNPQSRNDNTSGTLGALYCAERLVDRVKSGEVCVVLFDNEEWGLVGAGRLAAELRRRKVKMKERTVINFDCIGVGDRLIAATVGRQHKGTRAVLDAMDEGLEKKIVRKCSFVVYMSDHARFRDSFMLSAAKRSKLGPFYLPNIHTARDVECDLDLVGDIADRVCGVIEK